MTAHCNAPQAVQKCLSSSEWSCAGKQLIVPKNAKDPQQKFLSVRNGRVLNLGPSNAGFQLIL